MTFRFLVFAAFLGVSLSSCTGKLPEFDEDNALEKQVSGERAFQHVEALVGFGPRPAGSAKLEESRLYLIEQLALAGWEVQRQTFSKKTPEGSVEFVNLRARFGSDRWEKPIEGLLCSHYDTKLYDSFEFVGANDGGSSTGLLVELAHVLKERPWIAEKLELVFFDGEEAFGPNITPRDGLYGSRYYAAEITLTDPELRPRWGLLLDMVGDRDLKIRAGVQIPGALLEDLAKLRDSDYHVDIQAVKAGIQSISKQLLRSAEELNLRKEVGISPDYIVDDHIPLNVVAGIPTIDLIDFDYPFWHGPGDTLDKVSPDSLEISGRITLWLVEKYLIRSGH
jgi:hypothetical protein